MIQHLDNDPGAGTWAVVASVGLAVFAAVWLLVAAPGGEGRAERPIDTGDGGCAGHPRYRAVRQHRPGAGFRRCRELNPGSGRHGRRRGCDHNSRDIVRPEPRVASDGHEEEEGQPGAHLAESLDGQRVPPCSTTRSWQASPPPRRAHFLGRANYPIPSSRECRLREGAQGGRSRPGGSVMTNMSCGVRGHQLTFRRAPISSSSRVPGR